MQCSNNLKQLGLAIHNFHQAVGAFPSAGWGYRWAPHPDRGVDKNQPGGWSYSLLPYYEQEALFTLGSGVGAKNDTAPQLLQSNKQRLETPLSIVYCPTRRPAVTYPVVPGLRAPFVVTPILCASLTVSGRTDYAANGGEEWTYFGPGPDNLAGGDNGSYAFPSAAGSTGIVFIHNQFSLSDIRDGTSNTYMIGEKSCDPNQYATGTSAGDDQGPFVSDDRDSVRFADMSGTYLPPAQDRPGSDNTFSFGMLIPAVSTLCCATVQPDRSATISTIPPTATCAIGKTARLLTKTSSEARTLGEKADAGTVGPLPPKPQSIAALQDASSGP